MSLPVTQLLGFVFEGIGLVSGIMIALLVLKKDSRYLGNQLMAVAMILMGLYMGSILFYDILYPILHLDWIVQVFYRICVIALFFGTMFLFFTINVMSRSSSWFTKIHTIPYVVVILAYAVAIWFIRFLEILPGEQVNTQTSPMYPLYILIVGVVYFIVFSMIDLYRFGIKKADGTRKKKMITFFAGLAISMVAVIINVLSNLLADPQGILDVIFFGTLALAMLVMTFGFVGKQSKSENDIEIDMHE